MAFIRDESTPRQRWLNVRFSLKLQAEFRIGGNAHYHFHRVTQLYPANPIRGFPEHWIAARPRRSR
jgi:hypothetical protein